MKPTNTIIADTFEIRSATGNQLQMTRLFRFRYSRDIDQPAEDYLVAMETKRAPFSNQPFFLDVFRLDPITGYPLFVGLEEDDIYHIARVRYTRWEEAGFFLAQYRKRLLKKYDPVKILPYLVELEISLLCLTNPRDTILHLLTGLERKNKILKELHKKMCALHKGQAMKETADKLIFSLWADLGGEEKAAKLFLQVDVKNTLLEGLYELILLDAGSTFRHKAWEYILTNFWEKPCFLEDVREAFHNHQHKSFAITGLLARQEHAPAHFDVTREEIQELWFQQNWAQGWKTYFHKYYDTPKETT